MDFKTQIMASIKDFATPQNSDLQFTTSYNLGWIICSFVFPMKYWNLSIPDLSVDFCKWILREREKLPVSEQESQKQIWSYHTKMGRKLNAKGMSRTSSNNETRSSKLRNETVMRYEFVTWKGQEKLAVISVSTTTILFKLARNIEFS